MNLDKAKRRFLQDDVPTRIGGIAANLARVSSFSRNPANRDVVHDLLVESKYFIEWCAPEAPLDKAARLVELQIQLAVWQSDWQFIWEDRSKREWVSVESRKWSDEMLELSGLLDEQPSRDELNAKDLEIINRRAEYLNEEAGEVLDLLNRLDIPT